MGEVQRLAVDVGQELRQLVEAHVRLAPVPLGVALGVADITIRRFAERDAPVTHWTELPRGGNFLHAEQPELFVEDVRTFFADQQ